MVTKTFIVVNRLTGQKTPVKVEEGAMPADILNQLGLPNYQLATVKNRQVLPSSSITRLSCGRGRDT